MKFGKKFILAAVLLVAFSSLWLSGCSSNSNATAEDPNLTTLKDGNTSYLAGIFTNLMNKSSAAVRTDLSVNGQHPVTIVLTCADSRVPPEIILNKGLGEIFVIRVAGNIVGTYELASIEYGVEHLGAKQIVVLGHSKCGAVKEAFNNYTGLHAFRSFAGKPGFANLSGLVNAIRPAVTAAAALPGSTTATLWESAIDENVKLVKEQLVLKSEILKERIEATDPAAKVSVVGAKYDITNGSVNWGL
jgi:carbonic anhydrase